MKTIITTLILVTLAAALRAQTPPTNASPAKGSDDAIRRLLDQEYKKLAPTNPSAAPTPTPASATQPPAASTAAPAAALTNGVKPVSDTAPTPAAPSAPTKPADRAPVETKPIQPAAKAGEPATPSAATNVAGAPAPGTGGGIPAFPARNPLDLARIAAALRARGLTNEANALTNTALMPTNLAATASARTGAVSTAIGADPPGVRPGPPGVTRPAAGTPSAGNVAVPPAAAGAPAAPNVAGAVAPPAGGGAAAGAATNAAAEDIIPAGVIKFQDADVGTQVLEVYQELTGRTVLRPTALPATKITIKTQTDLTRREAILALDSILSLNGITMVPQGEKFVKAVPQAQANAEANAFYTGKAADLPEAGELVTYIVQLTNAVPQDVGQVLQQFAKMPNSIIAIANTSTLVIRDYAENVKRMLEVIKKIDVAIPTVFESVVIPIKYALASEIANVLGSLTTGGGVTTVGQSRPATGLSTGGGGFGAGMGGMGAGGGMGGMMGQQGYNQAGQLGGTRGMGTMGAMGSQGSQGGSRGSFSQRLQNIVQKAQAAASGEIVVLGNTKIIADDRTNSLLIYATKEDIATIKDIISKLDIVLAQVLIETLIFEVSLSDNLSYGFSYAQNQPTTAGNNFAGIGAINNIPFLRMAQFQQMGTNSALPGGFSYVANIGDKFTMTAQALAGDSRVNILQRPRIQTSHAVEANLFVGQTRPYPTGSSYGGVYGGYSQIQQLQIGVTLSVLPLINPDGLVVMDIRQKIQSVGGTVIIANVGEVPETIDREANAKVAVRDRETVVLGGFISNDKRKSASGVPILKDLPLLGPLFRSSSSSGDRKELMIMIRPTVLPSPADAALMAQDERSRMQGVSKLIDESNAQDRKSEEKTKKALLDREGLPN